MQNEKTHFSHRTIDGLESFTATAIHAARDLGYMVEIIARTGVAVGTICVLGLAANDVRLGRPLADVLRPETLAVIFAAAGIGLGLGVVRSLHWLGYEHTISASGRIEPSLSPEQIVAISL